MEVSLKRRDGRYMAELDSFSRFYTYLMPHRVTASCWTQLTANAGNLQKFIEEKKQANNKYTVFQAVIAALIRTSSHYPQLNRFIYGHKIYARKEYVISFAVNIGDKTVFRKVWFEPEDTISIVHEKIEKAVNNAREKPEDSLDNSVDFLMKLPGFISGFILKLYPWMVDKNIFPKKFVDEDVLYTSAIVSNLGTFGMKAPYHHLYEWGTASLFVTIGIIENNSTISFGFTVDERICDGKIISDALNFFKYNIENPWEMESPPEKVIKEC